jgi:hypothetical protein
MISPLRPRNANTWPENGFSLSTVCTCALRPSKPRRKSVTPAAIQILVPAGSSITCAGSQESNVRVRISATLDADHRSSRKLDVDRAVPCRILPGDRFLYTRRTRSRDRDRKQTLRRERGIEAISGGRPKVTSVQDDRLLRNVMN